ncbi:MAG: glycosyltransferase [Azonexus sp.]|nr:glycosyltransferase [Betaproteobacteria bacterium]MBK8917021.1 glycosyltransferase [Betaproteobacteria bacterium]MBP6037292.1 glycosyltransferase [Azonexus sp.]MBP6907848.1 glycosyltransferase [Azonexus sp.]
MKILIVTYSDRQGGAGKALLRIAGHLQACGQSVSVMVARRESVSDLVDGPGRGWNGSAGQALRSLAARAIICAATGSRAADRSLGAFRGGLGKAINATDADVVMLGWTGEETISIGEIAEIKKPVVWRFSDMWPLLGTEHYASESEFVRYTVAGAGQIAGAWDLDARVFRRKLRLWRRAIPVIAPSRWMGECVRRSAFANTWPVRIVPTPVDTGVFAPRDRAAARRALGLPLDRRLIVFGALGGDTDPRKGADLLAAATVTLRSSELACIIVGKDTPGRRAEFSLPTFDLGLINDDATLAGIYAAADVAVLPSRLDNLPQFGLEAQACGCPVVTFDTGGLSDLVEDRVTGALAEPFCVADLAAAIRWVVSDQARLTALSHAARERALALWAPEVVLPQYLDVFARAARGDFSLGTALVP